jgi:hypothetical protein
MKTLMLPAALAALMFATTPVLAQSTKPNCPPQPSASPGSTTKAPEKIEGEVTKIDPKTGTLTVKGQDGKTHEFRGSQDTVKEYKRGDKIELTLRQEPC